MADDYDFREVGDRRSFRRRERLQAEQEALARGMKSTLARLLKDQAVKEALAKEAVEAHTQGRMAGPFERNRLQALQNGMNGGVAEVLMPEEYAALWDRDLDDVG